MANEPTVYLALPWRAGPLTDEERAENICRARLVIRESTGPVLERREAAQEHSVWAVVCLEYEDLLTRLGHGLEAQDA